MLPGGQQQEMSKDLDILCPFPWVHTQPSFPYLLVRNLAIFILPVFATAYHSVFIFTP